MEESLNPTVNIGPISFDLTLLAMSLVTVLMVFAFVYWASRKNDHPSQGQTKCS